jgi:hypothetical protein
MSGCDLAFVNRVTVEQVADTPLVRLVRCMSPGGWVTGLSFTRATRPCAAICRCLKRHHSDLCSVE